MFRRLIVIVVACALVFVFAGTSRAQSQEVRLSLEECLRLALKHNLDLVSATYAPQVAAQDVQTQASGFDPIFQAIYQHRESENPPIQGSSVTSSKVDTIALQNEQALKFGGSYRVSFDATRFLQLGPNVLAPESFISSLSFAVNVPLLKGFGTQVTTELLLLARNNVDISRQDLERQAEQIMQQVEGSYWDVVAAREAVRIAKLAEKRAEDLLELNRKKVEVGTLAPIEITQAEAGVAAEVENVIIAEVTLADAEDELRRLLAVPDSDPMWNQSILNTTQPIFEEKEIDLQAAIDTALVERAEVHRARQIVRNNELSERVAQRETRHQLDFDASYDPQGSDLTFRAIGSFVPITSGNIGRSVANIAEATEDNWSAQLTYRIPVGNRFANADYARARLSRAQSEVDLQNQEQSIVVEVRRSARAVTSGIRRVEAARKNVELQQKKLDAEQKKFDNGMSTSFEVLTFQRDLADAQLSEIRARLDYIKALAALERSKGTLLESRNLSLADPTTKDYRR